MGEVQVVMQYAFVAMFPVIALAMLGPRLAGALAFPLLFLLLAVPFGEVFVGPLINLTADFTVWAVQATGRIAAIREAVLGASFELERDDWFRILRAARGHGFTYQKIFDQYDIIFNDDGSGEVADLVAINERHGIIQIDLYHCKYCPANDGVAAPGGRIGDTYEVCGQASRSAKWMHTGEALLSRLLTRYERSIVSGFDRMLKGDISNIDLLRYKCRDHEMVLNFYIVQPG